MVKHLFKVRYYTYGVEEVGLLSYLQDPSKMLVGGDQLFLHHSDIHVGLVPSCTMDKRASRWGSYQRRFSIHVLLLVGQD